MKPKGTGIVNYIAESKLESKFDHTSHPHTQQHTCELIYLLLSSNLNVAILILAVIWKTAFSA